MTDITEQVLRDHREQAERTSDEPLSGKATRPGRQRAKVLSVRLTPEEFDELNAGSESPVRTVERIAHELEQLRRQLVA